VSPALCRPALLAVLLLLVACGEPPPPEQRIRDRIGSMQAALEAGSASDFLDPMAEDFDAATRSLDRRAAGFLLRRELLAHQRLKARLVDIDVELQGSDRATASFDAFTSGGTGLIPDTGGWYRVTTGWRLDDDDWMLISARWEAVVGRE
jgi:hypothetical protein